VHAPDIIFFHSFYSELIEETELFPSDKENTGARIL
jgi:hypothetical protein